MLGTFERAKIRMANHDDTIGLLSVLGTWMAKAGVVGVWSVSQYPI
jgi:hypothetical protein